MNFGKNRVQFEKFEWYYYRFSQFDIYFYAGGKDNALLTAEIANKFIPEIENFFEYDLRKRIVFVIYHNLSDFRQSNIGLNTGDQSYNIGGVTKVLDNTVFLYIEGDRESLIKQIKAAIATIILKEMLIGDGLGEKVTNNALINFPEWYISGLVKYVSETWNSDTDNEIKNLLMSGKFNELNHLRGYDAEIAGYAIWNYIALNFGKSVIPNITYLTRVTKSTESGFLYVLGYNMKMLRDNINDFYIAQYKSFDLKSDVPNANLILKKTRKNRVYYQLSYNSNANSFVWAENLEGKYWIKIKDNNTGKIKTIYKREHRLEQITDYSYPILKWHPSGKLIGFIIEKEGEIYYMTYNLEENEIKQIELSAFHKILSFDYSHDGLNLVISGFINGQSDMYIYNIAANTFQNLTQDNADDYFPSFYDKSRKIIFTSNRLLERITANITNETEKQNCPDVFVYDITTKNIEKITNTTNITESYPNLKNKRYLFLSDKNGINNLYSAKIDSAVSFVDTITHYRYFLDLKQLTNYNYNLKEISYDKFSETHSFIVKSEGKYKLFYADEFPKPLKNEQIPKTQQIKINSNLTEKSKKQPNNIDFQTIILPNLDSLGPMMPINIYDYQFSSKVSKDISQNNLEFDLKGKAREPKMNKYLTTFYTNYLVTQVDFGFLNNSYQQFTGSAFYFNPGFNIFLKVGSYDLFEDYRITGAVRLSGNFDSNEYLLSFENLRKRWNKQFVIHRQVLLNFVDDYYIKTFTHEGFYIMRYPFSQVSAFQLTTNLRQNINSYLSIDYKSLLRPNNFDYWAMTKAEYIFDNTKELMTNILAGSRFKIFAEAYKQIDKANTELFVTGFDFRYYQPIHKNLIFAARLAGSSSFGTAKLIYYLGGVDNWINLSTKIPTFNTDIRIDPTEKYVYQAVATNLRGFSQNIRNGTNFTLINTELRWPIFSYLFKRPINNDFVRNLQIIGFFDIGSAWSGLTPFSGNNAYENDYYDNYPITIIIHNDNFPIVSGFGCGIRSKLFGYFVRLDWAQGIENNVLLPPMIYLSLSTDF